MSTTAQAITTVAAFAATCGVLDHNQIYELFEDEISDNLRNMIYAYADRNSAEPVRSALNRLGRIFDVDSLQNY